MVEQDGAITNRLDGVPAVGNDQQCGARLAKLSNAVSTFVLKVGIAHGKGFVDDQNIGAARRGDTEGQAHLHTAGVDPDRLIDVVADFREGFDFRHKLMQFIDMEPQQLSGHEHILPPGELRMETHPQFQKGCHPSGYLNIPRGWLCGAGNHLQQRALARAVDANNADSFAWLYVEADVLQHPFELVLWLDERDRPLSQAGPARRVLLVSFAYPGDTYFTH